MGEDGFYAVYRSKATTPFAVLRVTGNRVYRWIPHLKDWVEIPDHWDYLYDSTTRADKVSESQATSLAPDTVDLPDDVLARRAVR